MRPVPVAIETPHGLLVAALAQAGGPVYANNPANQGGVPAVAGPPPDGAHQQLDVFRAAVAGELGEHLKDLPQDQVHQRGRHAMPCIITACVLSAAHKPHVAATNWIYEPHTVDRWPAAMNPPGRKARALV